MSKGIIRESLHLCRVSCFSTPALPSHWLRAAHRKWGLNRSKVARPKRLQLRLSVKPAPCRSRPERCIFTAPTKTRFGSSARVSKSHAKPSEQLSAACCTLSVLSSLASGTSGRVLGQCQAHTLDKFSIMQSGKYDEKQTKAGPIWTRHC